MQKLFQMLGEILKTGGEAVLVSVIATTGSTPRGAGAKMLVSDSGRIYGTIGGGAVEFRSEKTACSILQSRQTAFSNAGQPPIAQKEQFSSYPYMKSKTTLIEHYLLRENEVQDLGMVCGGELSVFFQYIPPTMFALIQKINEMFLSGEQSWLLCELSEGCMSVYGKKTGIHGEPVPENALVDLKDNIAEIIEFDGRSFYRESLVSGTVFIFGGGHVSQALVPCLAALGFRCCVLEDRAEFCRPDIFPGAAQTCLIDNLRITDYIAITEDDYVVIMTRGHKDDQIVLEQVLMTPAKYIGMIGSRRKSEGIFKSLAAAGFLQTDIDRVITPIGLSIGAQTPEEIAVSIAAQLICRRRGVC